MVAYFVFCSFSLQRSQMTDFDRYKVMKAKKMVSKTNLICVLKQVQIKGPIQDNELMCWSSLPLKPFFWKHIFLLLLFSWLLPLSPVLRETRSSSTRWRSCRRRPQRRHNLSPNKQSCSIVLLCLQVCLHHQSCFGKLVCLWYTAHAMVDGSCDQVPVWIKKKEVNVLKIENLFFIGSVLEKL